MIQCSSCRFYHQLKARTPRSLGSGECRLRPPTVVGGSHDRFHPDFAIFPVVLDNDWCGEFAQRTASAGHRHDDNANAAFEAAAHEDATDTAVVAVCVDGEPLLESSPPNAS